MSEAKLRKHFPSLPSEEKLIIDCSCALAESVHGVPQQGHLWVTGAYLLFHAKILSRQTQLQLRLQDLKTVEKQSTASVVPNAMLIVTKDNKKYFLTSMRDRDHIYDSIMAGRMDTDSATSSASKPPKDPVATPPAPENPAREEEEEKRRALELEMRRAEEVARQQAEEKIRILERTRREEEARKQEERKKKEAEALKRYAEEQRRIEEARRAKEQEEEARLEREREEKRRLADQARKEEEEEEERARETAASTQEEGKKEEKEQRKTVGVIQRPAEASTNQSERKQLTTSADIPLIDQFCDQRYQLLAAMFAVLLFFALRSLC